MECVLESDWIDFPENKNESVTFYHQLNVKPKAVSLQIDGKIESAAAPRILRIDTEKVEIFKPIDCRYASGGDRFKLFFYN